MKLYCSFTRIQMELETICFKKSVQRLRKSYKDVPKQRHF